MMIHLNLEATLSQGEVPKSQVREKGSLAAWSDHAKDL